MLEKCVAEIYPSGTVSGNERYIADETGLPICSEDCIRVDREDGEDEIPWELHTRIKLSNPSRVRYYCVQRPITCLN